MFLNVQIKLTSEFLGQKRQRDGVRIFSKDKNKILWLVDLQQWSWAFKEAASALEFNEVDTSSIRVATGILLPTLALHRRRYTPERGKSRGMQEEMFESFRENSVITFQVLITSAMEEKKPGRRPPSLGEFESILAFVGEMVGLSPWGNKFGYGRFKVINIEKAKNLNDLHTLRRELDDDISLESGTREDADLQV